MSTRQSRDAAPQSQDDFGAVVDLSDGKLIPLGKLHDLLNRRKELVTQWRREGLEKYAFRIENRSLVIWSEDVRRWIRERYGPNRE